MAAFAVAAKANAVSRIAKKRNEDPNSPKNGLNCGYWSTTIRASFRLVQPGQCRIGRTSHHSNGPMRTL